MDATQVKVTFWCMRHGHPGRHTLSSLGEMQVMATADKYLSDTIFDAAYHSGKDRTLSTLHHTLEYLRQRKAEVDESPGLDYEWADTAIHLESPSVMEVYQQLTTERSGPVTMADLLAGSDRACMLQERFRLTLQALALIQSGHPPLGPETNERNILVASHATVIETLAGPTVQLAGYADLFRYVFMVDPSSRQTDLTETSLLPCPLNRSHDASAH